MKKTLVDLEREWGQAEWIVCLVRPPALDPHDKNVKKVLDRVLEDFTQGGRRDRVVRLDLNPPEALNPTSLLSAPTLALTSTLHTNSPRGTHGTAQAFGPPASPSHPGTHSALEEVEASLRECVRTSFLARQAAYVDESRRRVTLNPKP